MPCPYALLLQFHDNMLCIQCTQIYYIVIHLQWISWHCQNAWATQKGWIGWWKVKLMQSDCFLFCSILQHWTCRFHQKIVCLRCFLTHSSSKFSAMICGVHWSTSQRACMIHIFLCGSVGPRVLISSRNDFFWTRLTHCSLMPCESNLLTVWRCIAFQSPISNINQCDNDNFLGHFSAVPHRQTQKNVGCRCGSPHSAQMSPLVFDLYPTCPQVKRPFQTYTTIDYEI